MAESKEEFVTTENRIVSKMEEGTDGVGGSEDIVSTMVVNGGGSNNGSSGSRETLIVSSDSESREKDENEDDADVEDEDDDGDDENGSQSLSDSCSNISDGNNEKEITAALSRTINLEEKQQEQQRSKSIKAKAVRSLSSQSTSSTTTSTSVGTQNAKKMSSASPCSKDILKSPEPVRLTGYMEKRSKMLGWKKFWCVLDGRLLTYYKSKSEYESLSACCGSINLGIASTVRPIQIRGCKGYPLQIVTRTQVYYLRSLDKATSDHWLIAIQEAASSNPQITYPVWADPGTQFYRYSFASVSQWSLNTSTDDITSSSLNRTPQNFYTKNDRAQPLMQKCHSFTSLLSPVVNCVDKMSSSRDDSDSNTSSSFFRRRILGHSSSSHEQGTGKVRHSTSMLALESSKQASDLKKELSRKLSVGSTMSEKSKPLPEVEKLLNRSEETKDSSSASKVVKDNSSLKEDLKEEKEGDKDEDSGSHHYDEILDFEGANYENYEPCGKEENSGDNDIYEQVETLDDPWEKLDTKKVDLKFVDKRNSGNSQGRGSNRNSLVSISEVPEDIHNSKVKNLSAIPENKTMWKNVSFKNNSTSDEDSSNCSSIQNLSTASEKPGKKWKAIGGFFQKMFHKEKSKKGKEHCKNNSGPMVITGPVDLRGSQQLQEQQHKEKPKKKAQAPKAPPNSLPLNNTPHKNPLPVGSQLAINSENVMDELKKKVGTMKRFDSEGDQSSLSSKSSSVSTPTSETKDFIPSPNVVTNHDIKNHPIIQRKISNESISTIVAENQVCSTSPSDENKNPESKSVENSSSEKASVDPPTQVIRREKKSEEFQLKLARFNRLSQKLSPSFATALNPTPINPVFGQIGRSNSCKIQKNIPDEIIPPLPPKKKNQGKFLPAIYDVPLNNRPVTALIPDPNSLEDTTIPLENNNSNNNINHNDNNNESEIIHPLHKALIKKNSAPEIIFSSRVSRASTDSTKSLLRLSLDNTKDSVFEDVKSTTSDPPPRPPKSPPTNTAPVSTDEPMSLPTAVFENKENPCPPQENNNSLITSTQEAIIEDIVVQETIVNNETSHNETIYDTPACNYEEENINDPQNIIDELQIISSGATSLEESAEDYETSKDSFISVATSNSSVGRCTENSIMLEEIGESDDSLSLTTEQSENSLVVTDETIDSSVTSEKIEILINKTVEKLESISNSKENSNSSKMPLNFTRFNVEIASDSTKCANSYEDKNGSLYMTADEHDGSTTGATTGEYLSVNSKFSPTASNKSVDIDNLEILSDLSDSNGDESTSPESPRSTRAEEKSIPPPPPFPNSLMSTTPSSTPLEYEPLFPVLLNETEEVQVKETVDDSNSGLVIEETPREIQKLKEVTSEEPIIEHIYENVKFATIQTIVQELETVEENEDEMSELYDDFPCEFSTPSPKCKYGDSSADSSPTGLYNMQHHPVEKNLKVDSGSSIRHSGIDQLQAYLNSDMSANNTNNSGLTEEMDFSDESNLLSVFPPLPPIIRTGAVSRLGHSSAINQLQRIAENNN